MPATFCNRLNICLLTAIKWIYATFCNRVDICHLKRNWLGRMPPAAAVGTKPYAA